MKSCMFSKGNLACKQKHEDEQQTITHSWREIDNVLNDIYLEAKSKSVHLLPLNLESITRCDRFKIVQKEKKKNNSFKKEKYIVHVPSISQRVQPSTGKMT